MGVKERKAAWKGAWYLKASFLTILGENALVRHIDADANETHDMIICKIAHLQPRPPTTFLCGASVISDLRLRRQKQSISYIS